MGPCSSLRGWGEALQDGPGCRGRAVLTSSLAALAEHTLPASCLLWAASSYVMVKVGGLKGLRCLKEHFGAKESESAETQKAKGVLYLLDA